MNEPWIIPDWPVPEAIQAVSTVRSGGVSSAPYASLNLAAHVGDNPISVADNRQQLRQQLQLPAEPLWLRQMHGTSVIEADHAVADQAADGAYSQKSGVVCAVMTADCLPVLLYDRSSGAVAAIHAGWRGLADGILEAAVHSLRRASWIAWLGPAIGPQQFEVGSDVRDAMGQRSQQLTTAFSATGEDKWHADIYQIARLQLHALGVDNIYGGHWCTFSDDSSFFSYRRDGTTGRMVTLIVRLE